MYSEYMENTIDGLTADEWAQRFLIEFVQKGVIVK
jgi:hypothetical protein